MRFFTSDLHLGHANIIGLSKRPFASADEMDETLLDNINQMVDQKDELFILGDFTLKRGAERVKAYRDAIKCPRVHIVLGNHDTSAQRVYEANFTTVSDLTSIRLVEEPNTKAVLCHYAMRTWNNIGHGAWQLYGHSHGTLPPRPGYKSLDVGVDCWGYAPISEKRLAAIMDGITPVYGQGDHHEN